jgi:hypothetical protein
MELLENSGAWLSPNELDNARANLPIVYVDAIPVRVDANGSVTEVGLLLRVLRVVPGTGARCNYATP